MDGMVCWLRSSHALLVYKLLHKQWLNTWPTNFNALQKTSNLSCHDAWCKLVQISSQHGNHTSCCNLLWCACFDPITCCSIRPNRGQWGQIEWKWWSSTCKDLKNSKRCFEDAPSVPRLFFVGTMQFHCNVSEQWASKKRISAFYFDQPFWISLWEEKHAHPKPFRALKSLGQQHFHWATAHLTRTRLSEWLEVAQCSTYMYNIFNLYIHIYIYIYILESKTRWTEKYLPVSHFLT